MVPKVLIGCFEHLLGKVLIFTVLKIRYKKSLPLYNICDKSITIINWRKGNNIYQFNKVFFEEQ